MLKEISIILAVLIYWKFIYYKYHESKNGALVLLIPTSISILIGLSFYFFKHIFIPKHIFVIYFISLIYFVIGLVFILLASKSKKITRKIDVLSEWTIRVFGNLIFIIGLISSIPLLFFSIIGTYSLFGFEHIYLWIMIFLAWTRSGIKLFMRILS